MEINFENVFEEFYFVDYVEDYLCVVPQPAYICVQIDRKLIGHFNKVVPRIGDPYKGIVKLAQVADMKRSRLVKNSEISAMLSALPKKKVPDKDECSECDGAGQVTWEYMHWEEDFDCPACDGRGCVDNGKQVEVFEDGKYIRFFECGNDYRPESINDVISVLRVLGVENDELCFSEFLERGKVGLLRPVTGYDWRIFIMPCYS